jgi:Tol biopolymer transport system component
MIPGPDRQALVWVDDAGVESAVPGDDTESPEGSVEISPDGRRAVYVVGRFLPAGAALGSLTNATVLVRDLETGVTTRLNVAGQDETMWGSIGQPTWFPDGLRLLHRMGRIEGTNLVERRADIAGPARVVTPGMHARVLADGRTLVVARDDRGTARLARATIAADGTAGAGTPLFTRDPPPDTGAFDVSADGRLIAYMVRQPNERNDVFLASLAAPDEQYLVQEGGGRPRFTRDGSSLLFVRGAGDASGRPQGELVRVPVAPGPPISIGAPVVVFRDSPGSPRLGTFDTSADGRRFLMWKPVPPRPGEGQRLVLVQHALAAAGR